MFSGDDFILMRPSSCTRRMGLLSNYSTENALFLRHMKKMMQNSEIDQVEAEKPLFFIVYFPFLFFINRLPFW